MTQQRMEDKQLSDYEKVLMYRLLQEIRKEQALYGEDLEYDEEIKEVIV